MNFFCFFIYIIVMKIISILSFFIIILLMISNSFEIVESVKLSFSLCINNLFPSLIPFMLLSNILINYNFVEDLSIIFNKIMTKFFKVNKNCSFVFIMSLMSGTPSNAKYLKDSLDNNLITTNDCKNCLNFCHFTNPIFILGTIGYTFLKNKKLGLIILISHYLSAFIIGMFNKKHSNNLIKNISNSNKNNKFINILKNSINSTGETLFLIMGVITTCLIITSILNKILTIDNNYKFIYGIFEVTQGLNYLSKSNLNLEYKTIISSFLISFGGICIHAQVFSILDNKKIRYLPYFISRLIHGILSSILTFIILNI